eukprot:2887684-Prymnesium_polylepis.1
MEEALHNRGASEKTRAAALASKQGNKVRSFILHRSLELYATFIALYSNALFSRRPANAHGVGARTSRPPETPLETARAIPVPSRVTRPRQQDMRRRELQRTAKQPPPQRARAARSLSSR